MRVSKMTPIGMTGMTLDYKVSGGTVQSLQDFILLNLGFLTERMAQFLLKSFDRFLHGWVFSPRNPFIKMASIAFARIHLTGNA
jgi:hypothetical protein